MTVLYSPGGCPQIAFEELVANLIDSLVVRDEIGCEQDFDGPLNRTCPYLMFLQKRLR